MSRILYLARHAQAERGQPHQPDKERALTQQGKQDAIQLGGYLKQAPISINQIISSPANRALSTAYLVAQQLDFEPNWIQVEESIYSSNKTEIMKLLNSLDDSVQEALLIGHYPTIVELYNYLTMNESKASMNPAELCSVKFDLPWSEVTGGSGSDGITFYPHSI